MLSRIKDNQQGIAFVVVLIGVVVVLGIGVAIANVAVSNNANKTASILEQQNINNGLAPETTGQSIPNETPTSETSNSSPSTEKPSTRTPSSSPPSSPPPSSPSPAQPTTHNIGIYDDYFSQTSLTIKKGDTVKWTNYGTFHNVVKSGAFNSGDLYGGQTFLYMFSSAGTFSYECTYHNGMNGTITVQN